ncbi:MAG: DUF3817 domain-containing protein [Actinobacteria bacterium]|uniref:Unannotated protein n=1 Tax=freshwater metagenome TaxID=449393 RepID=A0A6J6R4A5_9ZZZZ|nr:DUF3817 domain-containing protein [Actinomycetota bacterium]
MILANPSRYFRTVARTEAVTWALLLVGMFLKYVTETTEVGVQVFGMVHGVVFLWYCVTTVFVAVDQRWSVGLTLLGLVSSIPPFATVAFDRYVERRGSFLPAWRLISSEPTGLIDRPVAWLLRHPLHAVATAVALVVVLTSAALVVGPPAS